LGIEAAVSFPGVVARERLGTLYAESSVFCLPSYREGLPMALLEAMALGLPSITTSVGGIGDVVEHDVSGLLVKPGDVDALAAAIERLASDPELARRLGAGAQERIRSMAGEEVIAEQWRELYARYVRS
jgi:glycosyltransferase involved in cell wall biosynthesis